MVIPWNNWNACYDILAARLQYGEFDFDENDISYQMIEETILQATSLVTDFRGKLSKRERYRTLAMSILLAIFVIWAIAQMIANDGYVGAIFILVSYLVILYIVNMVVKY